MEDDLLDEDRPNVARIYDYYLGGSHNFAADRAVADAAVRVYPALPAAARANRSFLRRAVRHLLDAGVDQFLDLGSGIPTVGNVHEIVQQEKPDARVVYVDIERVAVAHSRNLLADNPRATVIQADLRDPEAVLAEPELREMLDPARPLAVLIVAVLHWIPDADDPERIVTGYRDALAPGSYLVITHGSTEALTTTSSRHVKDAQDVFSRSENPVTPRSRERIAGFFDGLEMVPPGLVQLQRWRPDDDGAVDDRFSFLGAVARRN